MNFGLLSRHNRFWWLQSQTILENYSYRNFVSKFVCYTHSYSYSFYGVVKTEMIGEYLFRSTSTVIWLKALTLFQEISATRTVFLDEVQNYLAACSKQCGEVIVIFIHMDFVNLRLHVLFFAVFVAVRYWNQHLQWKCFKFSLPLSIDSVVERKILYFLKGFLMS